MINTCQAFPLEFDDTEPFEDRIDILFRELELAIKWQCPSVLLSIYSSEYVRSDADGALEKRLSELGQNISHIKIKSQEDADITLMISELADLSNVVFFVEGLRWGCVEDNYKVYRALNKRREFFIENQVRVVFWLTENEAIDLAHYAPDYWAFRHRVIEFVDSPKPEQISPHILETAWQGIGEFTDSIEDLDAKIALRTALLTDLPEGNESTAARANLLLTLGMLHWRRGDYERATQFLNTSLELATRLQDDCFKSLCFNAIALVETALGRTEEAIQAYQNAIELAPEQISPWNNLGNLYKRIERYEDALAAFQKAVEQNAMDVVSWNGLGDLYRIIGRYDDAIYAFLKATELSPDYALSWSGLGTSYANAGHLDEALAAHQKALEIDSSVITSWLGLGNIFKLQKDNEDAKKAYQTLIEVDPQNVQAWCELGDIYCDLEQYDEAILAYTKAVEFSCGDGQVYSKLASLYTNRGRYAEAVPLLQKGVELLEDAADKVLLWNRLGDAYRKLDDYDSAVAAYRRADELNPETVRSDNTPSEEEADIESVASPEDDIASPAPDLNSEISHEEAQAPAPVVASSPDEVSEVSNDAEPVSTKHEGDFLEWLEGLGRTPHASAEFEGISAEEQASAEAESSGEDWTGGEAVASPLETVEISEPEVVEVVEQSPADVKADMEIASTPPEMVEDVEPACPASQTDEPKASTEGVVASESDPAPTVPDSPVDSNASPAEDVVVESTDQVAPSEEAVEANVSASETADVPLSTAEQTNETLPAEDVVVESSDQVAQPEEVVEASVPASETADVLLSAAEQTNEPSTAEDIVVESSDQVAQPEEVVEASVSASETADVSISAAEQTNEPSTIEGDVAGSTDQVVPSEEVVEASISASESVDAPLSAAEQTSEPSTPPSIPEDKIAEDEATDQVPANVDTKNAQIWNELGSIYFNAGAYDEAIQAFSKAVELDQFFGLPYNNLASIYYQKEHYSEAVLLYQKAIKFTREAKDKALLWNKLGDAYRRLNEHHNAAIAYQQAVELDPGHVSLLTRARLSLLGNRRA